MTLSTFIATPTPAPSSNSLSGVAREMRLQGHPATAACRHRAASRRCRSGLVQYAEPSASGPTADRVLLGCIARDIQLAPRPGRGTSSCRRCRLWVARPQKSSVSALLDFRQDRAARPSSRLFGSLPPIGYWSILITATNRASARPAQSRLIRSGDPVPVMFLLMAVRADNGQPRSYRARQYSGGLADADHFLATLSDRTDADRSANQFHRRPGRQGSRRRALRRAGDHVRLAAARLMFFGARFAASFSNARAMTGRYAPIKIAPATSVTALTGPMFEQNISLCAT